MSINFFSDNIYFDDKTNHVNESTKFFNDLGNFFLSPARHLLNGTSVRYVQIPQPDQELGGKIVAFGNYDAEVPKGLENFLKNLISTLLVVPSTILGIIIKGAVLTASDSLMRNYIEFSKWQANMQAGEYQFNKENDEIAICLHEQNAGRLLSVLTSIKNDTSVGKGWANFKKHFRLPEMSLEHLPNMFPKMSDDFAIVEKPGDRKNVTDLISEILDEYVGGKIGSKDFIAKLKETDTDLDVYMGGIKAGIINLD